MTNKFTTLINSLAVQLPDVTPVASIATELSKTDSTTDSFNVVPKVQRALNEKFTINGKSVEVVEVLDGSFHVKNQDSPFDSFWI